MKCYLVVGYDLGEEYTISVYKNKDRAIRECKILGQDSAHDDYPWTYTVRERDYYEDD